MKHQLFTLLFLTYLLFSSINTIAQIRIKAVGDIMMGSKTPRTIIPPNNGKVFTDSIANYLDSANITFGNLEGVFAHEKLEPKKCRPESREAKRCYEFGMPKELSPRLSEMHFDVVSMDNNHASDYGWEGIKYTKTVLDTLNIQYASKKKPTIIEIDSIKIGVIAFGFSSVSWHVSNLKNATQQIQKLDSLVDLVIVSFHGGAEGTAALNTPNTTEKYYGEDRGNVIAFSHNAIDAGADLIIGHGPHVLRGMEMYKNKLISYSLGNFLTYGNVNITGTKGIACIMDITLDNITGDFKFGSIIPTKQIGRGIPVFDSNNESVTLINRLSKQDFPKSFIQINKDLEIVTQ